METFRSNPDNEVLYVTGQNEIGMYQTYAGAIQTEQLDNTDFYINILVIALQYCNAMYISCTEIVSISPNVGSLKGKTKVTISGDNFDETDSPAEVKIGGQ